MGTSKYLVGSCPTFYTDFVGVQVHTDVLVARSVATRGIPATATAEWGGGGQERFAWTLSWWPRPVLAEQPQIDSESTEASLSRSRCPT